MTRKHDTENRMLDIKFMREKKMETSIKDDVKSSKLLKQNTQRIWDAVKIINLRIIGIE